MPVRQDSFTWGMWLMGHESCHTDFVCVCVCVWPSIDPDVLCVDTPVTWLILRERCDSWLKSHESRLMSYESWLMTHGSWVMSHRFFFLYDDHRYILCACLCDVTWLIHMRDVTHDWNLRTHGSRLMNHHSWLMSHVTQIFNLCVTINWRRCILCACLCDAIHSCEGRDSSMWGTWLIHVRDVTHDSNLTLMTHELWLMNYESWVMSHRSCLCDVSDSYRGHDSCMSRTGLIIWVPRIMSHGSEVTSHIWMSHVSQKFVCGCPRRAE